MIKANDMRPGRAVIFNGEIFTVKEAQHVAKGNKRSYIAAKLKNMKSGQIIDERFNVDDRIEVPFVESKEYEYLYQDGDDLVLMDTTTYDQIHAPKEILGDQILFLKENVHVSAQLHEGKIIVIASRKGSAQSPTPGSCTCHALK